MDAETLCRRLDLRECFERVLELFWRKQTILVLETLWSFLRPSVYAAAHDGHREQGRLENSADHFASDQKLQSRKSCTRKTKMNQRPCSIRKPHEGVVRHEVRPSDLPQRKGSTRRSLERSSKY